MEEEEQEDDREEKDSDIFLLSLLDTFSRLLFMVLDKRGLVSHVSLGDVVSTPALGFPSPCFLTCSASLAM